MANDQQVSYNCRDVMIVMKAGKIYPAKEVIFQIKPGDVAPEDEDIKKVFADLRDRCRAHQTHDKTFPATILLLQLGDNIPGWIIGKLTYLIGYPVILAIYNLSLKGYVAVKGSSFCPIDTLILSSNIENFERAAKVIRQDIFHPPTLKLSSYASARI